jgi:hypothetical protein
MKEFEWKKIDMDTKLGHFIMKIAHEQRIETKENYDKSWKEIVGLFYDFAYSIAIHEGNRIAEELAEHCCDDCEHDFEPYVSEDES